MQSTYNNAMKALFVELPPFERYREQYMDDATFSAFQADLIKNPEAGDVIAGTGGLRKVRHGDPRRGKGKRGGLRIIYYWWLGRSEEHTSELQSLMRISYAVFCLKKKTTIIKTTSIHRMLTTNI